MLENKNIFLILFRGLKVIIMTLFGFAILIVFSCTNSYEVICMPNSSFIISFSKDENINLVNQSNFAYIIFTIVDKEEKPIFSYIWDLNFENESVFNYKYDLKPGEYNLYAIISTNRVLNSNNLYEFVINGFCFEKKIIKPYENININLYFNGITLRKIIFDYKSKSGYEFEFNFKDIFKDYAFIFDKLFYFYSLYIYFDLNNDMKYDSKKDKSFRITKGYISVVDLNILTYKAPLIYNDTNNHIGDTINIFMRTGIKIKTSLFIKNFFDNNNIYKIYFQEDFKFLSQIILEDRK